MSAQLKLPLAAPGVFCKLYRHPGCSTWVVRWFVKGSDVPYHSEKEAAQVLAARRDRRVQP
jgi:hypothetical protein